MEMRVRGFVVLTVSLTISLSALDKEKEAIEQGDRAYRAFNTHAAVLWYERADAEKKDRYDVLVRLTRAYNDLGRIALRRNDSSEYYYRRAITYADRLAKAYPDSATSWLMLALCHGSLAPFKSFNDKLELGRDVAANARKAVELDSMFSLPHVVLGIFYRQAAQLKWWETAIVNTILGKGFEGTLEQAEMSFRRALEIDPRNPFAWYELSRMLRSAGRNDEGIEALKNVIAIAPTNEREQQQHEDAERQLKRMQEEKTK